MTLVAFVPPFSPLAPCNWGCSSSGPAAQPLGGPSSNTGQKSQVTVGSLSRPLIDFCTLVFDTDKSIKLFKRMNAREILEYVFGTGSSIVAGPLKDQRWNFNYERNATLIDQASAVCGKVGIADSGEVCISLTGQGCGHVPSWDYVHGIAENLGAHLTRVDIAVDDYLGQWFDVEHLRALYHDGAFTMNGRPPQARHISDEGSSKGCSLYIGTKGHKELNVYDKGKQLGDLDSDYVRCELRLYAKRLDLDLDALVNPAKYFGGAYPVLEELVIGELERLQVKENMVKPSAKAMVEFMHTQTGSALGVLWRTAVDARGYDYAVSILERYLAREGVPGRFKHMTPLDLQLRLTDQLDELFPELT